MSVFALPPGYLCDDSSDDTTHLVVAYERNRLGQDRVLILKGGCFLWFSLDQFSTRFYLHEVTP